LVARCGDRRAHRVSDWPWLAAAARRRIDRRSGLDGLVDTAQNAAMAAAKQAVAAAPVMTRSALTVAERVLPQVDIVTLPAPSPAPPVPVAAPRPDDKPIAITGPGFLTAFSRIPMEVYADGKRIGTTEDGQLLIASGTHQIEFVSQRFHYRQSPV
jgi:hypothetical protein